MKINAYLENCRMAICDALRLAGQQDHPELRKELIFALNELDAFRHGTLQHCDKCGYEGKEPEGP